MSAEGGRISKKKREMNIIQTKIEAPPEKRAKGKKEGGRRNLSRVASTSYFIGRGRTSSGKEISAGGGGMRATGGK